MSIPSTPSPLATIIATGTYDVNWFSGATLEAKIQSAINSAVADGAPRVLVHGLYNGTQIVANVNSKLVIEGSNWAVYDVRAYGAIGNGITDDTIAIQAAANAAGFAGGGQVYFPPGDYLVTTSITIPTRVQCIGAGAGFTDEAIGNKTSCLHSANGTMAGLPILDVNSRCAIRDLGFKVDGNNARFNTVLAIADVTNAATFVLVDRCHFARFGGAAIKLGGGVNIITQNRADNCNSHFIWLNNDGGSRTGSDSFIAWNDSGGNQSFQDVAGAVGAAVFIDSGGDNTIIGNELYEYQFGIWLKNAPENRVIGNRTEKNGQTGIQVDGGGGGIKNLIANNVAFNNGLTVGQTGSGIKLDNVSRNKVIGNVLCAEAADYGTTAQKFGIWVNNASTNNNISENYVDSQLDDSIRVVSGCHNNKVHNNHIYNGQKHGISVDGSDDCAITENYIYAPGQATDNTYDGIVVGSNTCNRTTISRNTVRSGGGAKQPVWGIQVVAGGTDTVIEDNDLRNSCRAFPTISDGGTRTQRSRNKVYLGAAGLSSGVVNLAAANPAATILTTEVATGDTIRLTRQAAGGTLGHLSIGAITNQTSFTIVSSGNLDTSVILWEIVH